MGGSQTKSEEPVKTAMPTLKRSADEPDVVVIPIDASKQAESAFLWYVKHVHKPEDVVRIVHCQEIEPIAPLRAEHQFSTENWADMMARTKKNGMDLVNRYEDKMKNYDIKGSVHFETGSKPGEMVIGVSEKFNASHIIMGSRGYGLIRRTVLGSVSDYVIHHTKVPVTIVPPETQNWFF